MTPRKQISETFSEWIAFSGTRSGCPLKARSDIYPLIRLPDYNVLLAGNDLVTAPEFSIWHRRNAELINNTRPSLGVGWTTKLINLYLKSMVYLAGFGRPGLVELIHPPIDNGLWDGIGKKYKGVREVISDTHSKSRIKDIRTYEDYERIIEGIKKVAISLGCLPIEVEQLWEGTSFKSPKMAPDI